MSDVKKLYVLSPICDELPAHLDDYIKMNGLSATLADADERLWPLAKRYAPTLKDVLANCKWRSKQYDCSDLFDEVLTDEGVCFSFNLQNASELYNEQFIHEHYHVTRHNKPSYYRNGRWNIPPDVDDGEDDVVYPRRVYVGSEGLRFELILNKKDKDYVCSGPVQSFKIQFSSFDNHPQMKRNFYRIPMSYDIVMSVHPNIMNSTDQLIQHYSKEKRQCINAEKDDRHLLFFQKYTQRNCQLEALSRRQYWECNCVDYWLPREKNQTICRSADQLSCLENIESKAVLKVWNGSQVDFDCMVRDSFFPKKIQ